jgi:hypothetical protein
VQKSATCWPERQFSFRSKRPHVKTPPAAKKPASVNRGAIFSGCNGPKQQNHHLTPPADFGKTVCTNES